VSVEEQAFILHQMWMAGETCEAIGKRLGVSTSTAHKLAQRYKLPKRPKPMRTKTVDPTPEEIEIRKAECRAKHMAQRRTEDVNNTHSKVSKWRRGICQTR
jgi:transposase